MKIGEFELNKIYCMDCLEGLKKLPDNSVDLVVTDPPYGMNFQSNYRNKKHKKIYGDDYFPAELITEFKRIAKRGVYIFCRWDNIIKLSEKPQSVICWVKNNWSMGDLKHEHGRMWESILFYNCTEHEFTKRIPDVIYSNRTGNNLHPTQKPVDLIKEIIRCNVGDIILDPFIGSGTTAVAAKQLGRNFTGFEISPEYCKIAEERLKQDTFANGFDKFESVPKGLKDDN